MNYITVAPKGYNFKPNKDKGQIWPGNFRRISGVIWVQTPNDGLWMPHDLYVWGISEIDQLGMDYVFGALRDFRLLDPVIKRVYAHEWGPDLLICMQYLEASLKKRKEARQMIFDGTWDRLWDEIIAYNAPRI